MEREPMGTWVYHLGWCRPIKLSFEEFFWHNESNSANEHTHTQDNNIKTLGSLASPLEGAIS